MANSIKRETIILIFDRNGKFYQYGFHENLCAEIAKNIRGSYKVVEGD